MALPQRGEDWAKDLPRLPLTAYELAVLRQLALAGSISADIVTYLRVTRAVAKEALPQLRHQRHLRTNLAGILRATRLKILVNVRV